jgi:RNA polymerase-binding transcription factor DksA
VSAKKPTGIIKQIINGGNNMNANTEKLLMELRQTKTEIERSLATKQKKDWLRVFLEDELADVDIALAKIAEGNFGQCEISGEWLPVDLLATIPTIRSVKDSKAIGNYYRKPM